MIYVPKVVKDDANAILSKLIDEKGIKRTYLAERVGISPASMSALLHGRKKFTADLALQIGKVLDVPYTIFLTKSYS